MSDGGLDRIEDADGDTRISRAKLWFGVHQFV